MCSDTKKDAENKINKKIKIAFEKLKEKGIDMETLCCADLEGAAAKVICVAHDLGESVHEMCQTPRGEAIMVRIDEETRKTLDSWIETGYVKSRSEAAALFMREGLKIRAEELEKLKDALKQVEMAKSNLREKAREIFGDKKGDENKTTT